MTRRTIALVLAAVAALSFGPAHADDETCTVSVNDAGPDAPHMTDPTNDWHGPALGDGDAGGGDVYREGTDFNAAWIERNAAGTLEAHIRLASMSSLQPNANYFFVWNYAGSDPAHQQRWVSARLKGAAVVYDYGYHTGPSVPAGVSGTYALLGYTTGHLVEGTPGEIVIDIPFGGTGTDPFTGAAVGNDLWGNPPAGAVLSLQLQGTAIPSAAQSAFLVGSPEPLPQNPLGLKHGVVLTADDSENALTLCDAVV